MHTQRFILFMEESRRKNEHLLCAADCLEYLNISLDELINWK
jgi:hypothetical protein